MSRNSRTISAIIFILILFLVIFALPALAAPSGQEPYPPERVRPDLYSYVGPETTGNMPTAGGAPSLPSQFSPGDIVPWSRIVFESYRDMNWEIYKANGDGSNPVRLTSNDAIDMQPRYNRGTTRIAFSSNRYGNFQLFTMNPDGSDVTQITNYFADSVYPYWSPDGTRIVFQSYIAGQSDIYTINPDGTNLTRLTADADYDGMPSWSPYGTKIAFISHRSGGYSVWLMNADGTNPYMLFSQAYSESPIFSPGGTKILYDSDSNGDGWQDLWVIDVDGSNQHLVRGSSDQTSMWSNTWSPDGQFEGFTQVFFVYSGGQWYWASGDLYGLELNGQFWVDLNPNNRTEWNFDWQTTDGQSPTTEMTHLPIVSPAAFTVSWSGYDPGESGFMDYDVQYKDNVDGAWTDWLMSTTDTSAEFSGVGGHIYFFRVRGIDNAYNFESWPPGYDAYTVVENHPPDSVVQTLPAYSPTPLRVSWLGMDPGGSGIRGYDVQYRQDIAGSWVDWLVNTSAKSAIFTGIAGDSYTFRVRATDFADNIEPWTAQGDTSTILFTWGVFGKATDNRGVPISNLSITTVPGAFGILPGDTGGAYGAFVLEKMANYTVEWGKTGYADIPLTSFTPDQGRNTDISLPPLDNIIMDWGMENGGAGGSWIVSGVYTPEITSTIRHTGDYGMIFPAPEVGFSAPEELYSDYPHNKLIAIGPDGTIHVLWSAGVNGQVEVYYSQRPAGGSWSSPVDISNTPENSNVVRIVVDSTGAIHVIWAQVYESSYISLYYSRRDPYGAWSDPIQISIPNSNSSPQVRALMDQSGVLHILWSNNVPFSDSHVYYIQRYSDGSWSDIQMVSISSYSISPDFVIDTNGLLHAVWNDWNENELYYSLKDASGAWSSPIQLATDQNGIPRLGTDSNGTVHLVYEVNSSSLKYSYLQAGTWSPVESFPSHTMTDYLSLLVEPDGQINVLWKASSNNIYFKHRSLTGEWSNEHLLGSSDSYPDISLDGESGLIAVWSNSAMFYARRSSAGIWSDAISLTPPGDITIDPRLAVDSNHQSHITYLGGSYGNFQLKYIGPGMVNQSGTGEASQLITLPVNMTVPTVSFWYQANGVSQVGNTWFELQVQDEISSTEVFSTNTNLVDWTHQWVDMSAWSGQTVTLTFRLNQEEGSQPAWASLDEVTLGAAHPDVWVDLYGGVEGVHPGDQFTFQLDYGNRGGSLAAATIITMTLPTELIYVSSSMPPDMSGNQLVWQVGDLLADTSSVPITLTVQVDAGVPMGQTVLTSVELATMSSELETLNNSSQLETYLGYFQRLPVIRR